jgi:hypothetical protein
MPEEVRFLRQNANSVAISVILGIYSSMVLTCAPFRSCWQRHLHAASSPLDSLPLKGASPHEE